MATIDILMAVHNPNEKYFRLSLNAIAKQTFRDFRLVIIDDGTNNCDIENIVREYDIEYIYIKNDINLGLAKSLNRGLAQCTAEYIARMDDDDIMTPKRLQMQYEFAKTHEGFIFCDVKLIDKNGNILPNKLKTITDLKKYLKKNGNCFTHSALFVKREILNELGGYDERFIYAQDYALYMKAIDKYEFYMINEVYVYYRIPIGRSTKMKEILSLLNCYAAAVEYFSRKKTPIHLLYFFRRSGGMLRQMYRCIRLR